MTLPDLRFALRRLGRHRSASLAAVLTLALGIGAITALFSAVRPVLLQPPPFRAPEELVTLEPFTLDQPDTRLEISYPDYRDWRAGSRSFQELAAVQTALGRVVWEDGGEPVPAAGSMVSGHFFHMLGTLPAIGRALEPADDRPGAELVRSAERRPLAACLRRPAGRAGTHRAARRADPHRRRRDARRVRLPAERRLLACDRARGRQPGRQARDRLPLGGRAPQVRSHGGSGRGRDERAGGSRGASGAAPGRAHRRAAPEFERPAHRRRAAGAPGAFRRHGPRTPHRLRERRQPAAGAAAGTPARARRAHRARCEPRSPGAAAPRRERGAGPRRRGAWRGAGGRRGRCTRRDGACRAVSRPSGGREPGCRRLRDPGGPARVGRVRDRARARQREDRRAGRAARRRQDVERPRGPPAAARPRDR